MEISALIYSAFWPYFLAFIILNWFTIIAPTALNLTVAEVNAPLGLMMLGILGVLYAVFLTFMVYLQTPVLFEARHAKEL